MAMKNPPAIDLYVQDAGWRWHAERTSDGDVVVQSFPFAEKADAIGNQAEVAAALLVHIRRAYKQTPTSAGVDRERSDHAIEILGEAARVLGYEPDPK